MASATCFASLASSMAWPLRRARRSVVMLSGRGMLPTCVVRMRCVLVFMCSLRLGQAARSERSGKPLDAVNEVRAKLLGCRAHSDVGGPTLQHAQHEDDLSPAAT